MKKSDFVKLITETLSSKLNEEFNPADKITLDVPLFIRLLEYAREDAKTDMDLHNVTEKAVSLSTEGKILTMSDYNNMIDISKENMNEMLNPKLEKIANQIRAKFPKQGSYDPGELFDKYIGDYNLSSEEDKMEVYAIIRDKENEELAESNINEEKPSMFVTGGNINPELRKKVEQFVKGIAKYYDYSVDDAFLAIMTILKGGLVKELAIGEKKLTPAELKKREEIVKSMKDTFKGPKAAMYAIATDKAKKVAEDLDIGHQDDEPDMLKADVARIAEYANKLYIMLDKFDKMPTEVDFPDWWQSKIHIAAENMDKATHYLEFEMKQPSIDRNINLAEKIIKKLKAKKQ